MATRSRALAAPVDVSTGDQRRLVGKGLTARNLPMAIRWVRSDVGGHDEAVVVGAMDMIDIGDGGAVVEWKWLDDIDPAKMPRLAEDVAEAMKLAREGLVGLSVDLDKFNAVPVRVGTDTPLSEADMDDPDLDMEMLVTEARICSATLVPIPAFAETSHTIQFMDEDDEAVSEPDNEADAEPELALVASVSGDTELPVLEDRDHPWDGAAAAARIFDEYSDEEGRVDKSRAGRGFLWVEGDGTERGQYKLPFADLVDGELRIVPAGVAATAAGRGVDSTDLTDEEKAAVKSRICSLYASVRSQFDDWPECPFDLSEGEAAAEVSAEELYALVASQLTAGLLPAAAFAPPVPIDGPTQITYDWDAVPPRAYGHIYEHGTCHVGFKDECRTPPTEEDFSRFHVHPVETESGTVFAGRLTAGGFHANDAGSLAAVQREHDRKATVAYVTAQVDDYGIFVCGPLLDVDAETRGILARRKVSGHWPVVGPEGELALAELLALPPGPAAKSEPGFPIHRVKAHYWKGRFAGLTASLGPDGSTAGAPEREFAAVVQAAVREAVAVVRAEDEQARLRTVMAGAARAELLESLRGDLARTIGV